MTKITIQLGFKLLLLATAANAMPILAQETTNCPPPVLSRLQRHLTVEGETVESIASRYQLLPDTLIRLNPNLQGKVSAGQEILIPPFNGVKVEVPQGATWKDLEAAYGVRADVLFEVNGCQQTPTVVFLPGVTWRSSNELGTNNYTGLSGYPLPAIAQVGLTYGWQNSPTNQQGLFHSGVDLLAEPGTPVLAAEAGTIIYVGKEGEYGVLIVIEHAGGRQTRYAHLNSVQVAVGRQVASGDVIGTVGTSGAPDLAAPHLHFEVRYNTSLGWVAQDPMIHLRQLSSPRDGLPLGKP